MQRLPIAIEDALVAWIQAVHTDATVIWANQKGKKPGAPFIVLDVIAGPQNIGPAGERYAAEDTYRYGFRKRATLNVQIFADDALVRAQQIANAIELPSFQGILQQASISVWGTEGPQNVTELLDTIFEPRANLDLLISYPDPIEDVPGEIRRVRVTGEVESVTTDQIIDIET